MAGVRKAPEVKFKEQSEKLMNNILPSLRALRTLTKYAPTTATKAFILTALQAELDGLEGAFSDTVSGEETVFELPA